MTISRRVCRAAEIMAGELESQRLQVEKAPPKRGRGDRCYKSVVSYNPVWYQKFCAAYESTRKDRTRWRKFKTAVKRRETLDALRRIAAGNMDVHMARSGPSYTIRLIPVIEAWIKDERARRRAERKQILSEVPF